MATFDPVLLVRVAIRRVTLTPVGRVIKYPVFAEVQEANPLAAGGLVGEKSSTRFVTELAAMAATFVSNMKALVESPVPLTPPAIDRVDQSTTAGSALKSAV